MFLRSSLRFFFLSTIGEERLFKNFSSSSNGFVGFWVTCRVEYCVILPYGVR